MRPLPRLAVGTIQPDACRQMAVWGLVAALTETGDSPVPFRSSLDLSCADPARSILGRRSRHLDSWAMSRSDAISALARGSRDSDTAIVEGQFDSASTLARSASEGDAYSRTSGLATSNQSSLDRLCEWLDLPRVAVIDVQLLAQRSLPQPPRRIDGLLLDRVRDDYDAAYWQTTLEAIWKTPVLGWLDEAPALRTAWRSAIASGPPPREICQALGQRMLRNLRLNRLRQLARRGAPLSFEPEAWLVSAERRSFRIAVAIDEVFCGYYPETLDLLEAAGAELCDFSPLRSEAIPDHVELVYFGCGHPEREAEQLSANHCFKQSLRSYAAGGGRIYAEGGGLAYLCREIVLPGSRTVPMTGLLPASACWPGENVSLEPVEATFGLNSWLAPAKVTIRGYRHAGWQLVPRGPMLSYATGDDHRLDFLGRGNVIGSRVLINLAANRHLLRRFFEPYSSISLTAPRSRD